MRQASSTEEKGRSRNQTHKSNHNLEHKEEHTAECQTEGPTEALNRWRRRRQWETQVKHMRLITMEGNEELQRQDKSKHGSNKTTRQRQNMSGSPNPCNNTRSWKHFILMTTDEFESFRDYWKITNRWFGWACRESTTQFLKRVITAPK